MLEQRNGAFWIELAQSTTETNADSPKSVTIILSSLPLVVSLNERRDAIVKETIPVPAPDLGSVRFMRRRGSVTNPILPYVGAPRKKESPTGF